MLIFSHTSLPPIKRTYVLLFPAVKVSFTVSIQTKSIALHRLHPPSFPPFFPCVFYNCWHGFSSPVNNEWRISQWVILRIRSCMSKVTRWLKCQQLQSPACILCSCCYHLQHWIRAGCLTEPGGKNSLWNFPDIQQEWSGCYQPSWGFRKNTGFVFQRYDGY